MRIPLVVRVTAFAVTALAACAVALTVQAAPALADHCQPEELVGRMVQPGFNSPIPDNQDPRCQLGAHLSCPNQADTVNCAIGASQSTGRRLAGHGSGDTLGNGQVLRAGDYIISNDNRYRLIMQDTGDLQLLGPGGLEWSTNTGLAYMGWLIMQADGNLVIYSANGTPVWATGTSSGSSSRLVVQNDGNVVIYSSGGPVWSRW
jgi:hypothetical protein